MELTKKNPCTHTHTQSVRTNIKHTTTRPTVGVKCAAFPCRSLHASDADPCGRRHNDQQLRQHPADADDAAAVAGPHTNVCGSSGRQHDEHNRQHSARIVVRSHHHPWTIIIINEPADVDGPAICCCGRCRRRGDGRSAHGPRGATVASHGSR